MTSKPSVAAAKGPTREEVHRLAAEASVDWRTAERALKEGVDKIRGVLARERITAALARMAARKT